MKLTVALLFPLLALAACDSAETAMPIEDEINAVRPITEVLVVPAEGVPFTLRQNDGLGDVEADGGFLVADYDGTRQYFSLTEAMRVIVRTGEVALYYR